jgi:small subunit ribosomal protein S2
MAVVTTRQLLESGVHFGHQTRRWNPKMKRFIFTERNGIYIIDLQQSLSYIDRAYDFVSQTVAHGGTILFVGTKKQAQEPVADQAARVGMPYVNQRWLGGMLTNFKTIRQSIKRLTELDDLSTSGALDKRGKKEAQSLRREMEKLNKSLGGIKEMGALPDALFVIDVGHEEIAVHEAQKLGIPVVAVVDTNCSPDGIDYVIPGNDDAMRAIQLYAIGIADAINDGKQAIPEVPAGEDEFVELDEEGNPKKKTARRRPAPPRKKAAIRRKPAAKVLATEAPAADSTDVVADTPDVVADPPDAVTDTPDVADSDADEPDDLAAAAGRFAPRRQVPARRKVASKPECGGGSGPGSAGAAGI